VLHEIHEKYVKLLRALCTCNQEPITINQVISKAIFEDYNISKKLIYSISEKNS